MKTTKARTRIVLFAWAAAALSIVLGTVPSARALTTERVAAALNRPIFVTSPPGDLRLFIVEQRGVIKILKNGAVLSTAFLNIDALIPDPAGDDERGLLGLAFDPEYATTGRFYLRYYSNAGQIILARYRVSTQPDRADPASAEILLALDHPQANHNGGTIAFSPIDGYLYLGTGDGGGSGDQDNNAQNSLVLHGKFLRIDVSGVSGYTVPPSNPFVGDPEYLPEIWAMGVRNPYRWCFDRLTGDLWIADVGQNLWEEIDYQPASSAGGENYGWHRMEGNHCYNPPTNCEVGFDLVHPFHEYSHASGACSITGGYVYRGTAIQGLQGTYFFADYCSDHIWSLRYDGQNVTEFTDRTAELAPGGGLSITSIAGFGEDSGGELYIVDRGTATTGEVYKIRPDAADAPDRRSEASPLEFRSALPNPFVSTTSFEIVTAKPGFLVVSVLDAGGRSIRKLTQGARAAGLQQVTWDGKDDEGRLVPAGVYFARARLGGDSVDQRVCIIR